MGLADGAAGFIRRSLTAASALLLPVALQAEPPRACDPVAVALGKAPAASCPGLDGDSDGTTSLAELLRATGASGSSSGGPRTPGVVTLAVGNGTGRAGTDVTFDVTMDAGGREVTATLNDIAFQALTPVAANLSGDPDCTVNPSIDKDVFTSFQPFGCTLGVDCTAIRVIVIALFNLDPIPDGLLHTCRVGIDPAAPPGTYPLVVTRVESSSGEGEAQPTVATDGAVIVLAPLDHYKCYKAKDLKNPKFQSANVALSDQFEDESAEVKKPFLFCNPVSKNGEAISNPSEHLTCYKIKSPTLAAQPKVEVVNQLGTVQLQAKKASLLCVPSSKQILP